MSQSAREYLAERFKSDAAVLRERADAMGRGAKVAGPDMATSRAMADACEQVAMMISAVVQNGDAGQALDALGALIPLLEQRANAQRHPAVRSVYAGAATRIREVRAAEADANTAERDDALDDDLDGDLDDTDDADVDDDDLPDDRA